MSKIAAECQPHGIVLYPASLHGALSRCEAQPTQVRASNAPGDGLLSDRNPSEVIIGLMIVNAVPPSRSVYCMWGVDLTHLVPRLIHYPKSLQFYPNRGQLGYE